MDFGKKKNLMTSRAPAEQNRKNRGCKSKTVQISTRFLYFFFMNTNSSPVNKELTPTIVRYYFLLFLDEDDEVFLEERDFLWWLLFFSSANFASLMSLYKRSR